MSYHAQGIVDVTATAIFDYAARGQELANQTIATVGAFQPYIVVTLGKNGTSPNARAFQDKDEATSVYTQEANTLTSAKAYVGLFDADGAILERTYGTLTFQNVMQRMKGLALPIIIGGVLIGGAVFLARAHTTKKRSTSPKRSRSTRRRAARARWRRRTTTTWRG